MVLVLKPMFLGCIQRQTQLREGYLSRFAIFQVEAMANNLLRPPRASPSA